jgi:apoptotic chromatin condensation inducer in the nucleus
LLACFIVDGEAKSQEPTKRQRRWNTGKIDIDVKAASPKMPMTEYVKEETPSEVKETASSFAALPPTVPVSSSSTPKSASVLERTAITRPTLSRSDTSFNGEAQKTRVVPPSTKPPTTSLKIDKFLRPFTHKAVKELLANTGVVQAMWMDQIKTHCYVTYSTVEEAVATRNALYNLQWPPQGGRLLTAEFVESEEVKIRCDGEKAALSNVVPPRGPVPPPARETPAEHAVSAPPPTHPSSLPPVPASGLPPPPPLPPPPRERPSMPSKQEMELQGPTLDDLFKKTRAKPHIYYLPLTEKDVAEKLAARRQASMIKPSVKT